MFNKEDITYNKKTLLIIQAIKKTIASYTPQDYEMFVFDRLFDEYASMSEDKLRSITSGGEEIGLS